MSEHIEHLRMALEVVRQHTLFAKMTKCVFATSKVEYLRHVISAQGVSTDPIRDDASRVGIGAALQQRGHPIAFMSKALSQRHQALSTYNREFIGSPFHHQDISHKSHTSIGTKVVHTSSKKWLPKLIRFDYDIVYKKGSENGVANTLYRFQGNATLLKIQVSSIAGDLCLPPSQGKCVIFVVVDSLSKYANFMSLAHPFTASTVAQCFFDNIYKLHGLPKVIVSDRDKVFLSTFHKELFKCMQGKLHLSTAYHPQTNGQTEVANRCLESYLRFITSDQPKCWSKWLTLAEYWYNTNYHSPIQTTPYEAVYGQPHPLPIVYTTKDSRVEAIDRSPTARENAIAILKFHLKRAQDRMKN
ncbi:uncharacterized protein [Rutidosis leptorrhynchoides]|uniref:uncharacterized protein n=1 Tax=Rutidosis leptorrhynchoides TaxID=125765 RepID=UPI003A9A26EA